MPHQQQLAVIAGLAQTFFLRGCARRLRRLVQVVDVGNGREIPFGAFGQNGRIALEVATVFRLVLQRYDITYRILLDIARIAGALQIAIRYHGTFVCNGGELHLQLIFLRNLGHGTTAVIDRGADQATNRPAK